MGAIDFFCDLRQTGLDLGQGNVVMDQDNSLRLDIDH